MEVVDGMRAGKAIEVVACWEMLEHFLSGR